MFADGSFILVTFTWRDFLCSIKNVCLNLTMLLKQAASTILIWIWGCLHLLRRRVEMMFKTQEDWRYTKSKNWTTSMQNLILSCVHYVDIFYDSTMFLVNLSDLRQRNDDLFFSWFHLLIYCSIKRLSSSSISSLQMGFW